MTAIAGNSASTSVVTTPSPVPDILLFTPLIQRGNSKVNNIDQFKTDFDDLVTLGRKMRTELLNRDEDHKVTAEDADPYLERDYQRWYTGSCFVMKQLLPDRLTEFEQLYKGDGKRKEINRNSFNIQDWLHGSRSPTRSGRKIFNDRTIVLFKFHNQLAILESVAIRLSSTLAQIAELVRADLFDSELEAAKELLKNGYLRAAGVVAGVVLEKHLAQVVDSHNCKTRKKKPTISDFNDLLKNNSVLDVPAWRQIQRFSDIRNLCAHNSSREPTSDEVDDLINGIDKIIHSLF